MRRPISALLSFLVPGVGQFFGGRTTRGLAFIVGGFVVQGAIAVTVAAFGSVLLAFALGLGFQVAAAVDAWRGARDESRWGTAALALVIAVVADYGVAFLLRANVAEPFRLPTSSMADTLRPGDRFLVDKVFFEPRRGDVVVYRVVRDGEEQNFVKRIVGLPGERVEMRGSAAVIDGKPLDEPYVRSEGDGIDESFVVPEGSYFLLGDNRPRSLDSRVHGAVPRDRIVGQARAIFWSEDWDRVGKRIR